MEVSKFETELKLWNQQTSLSRETFIKHRQDVKKLSKTQRRISKKYLKIICKLLGVRFAPKSQASSQLRTQLSHKLIQKILSSRPESTNSYLRWIQFSQVTLKMSWLSDYFLDVNLHPRIFMSFYVINRKQNEKLFPWNFQQCQFWIRLEIEAEETIKFLMIISK